MAGSILFEQDTTTWPLNHFILALPQFILTKNYFTFNDQLFLQTQGVAMGTSCAPAYANLYLGGWERYVYSDDRYADFLDDTLLWYRFIDDLFLVWTGSKDKLLDFLHELDDNDLNIIKQQDGTLGTDLYRKPTAGNTLLYATSAHPRSLVRSIPYTQYLQLRRNCTLEGDFRIQAKALRERLLLRGYSSTNLRKAFNKASSRPQISLLFNRPKPPSSNDPVMFITTYSAHHNVLRTILSNNWHLLAEHHILGKHVQPAPELVFRRACSLLDQLTSSHYTSDKPPRRGPNGTFRCGDCPRCPWVCKEKQLVLPNGDLFTPRTFADCGTRGVIYLMLCTCKAFYVGKTI